MNNNYNDEEILKQMENMKNQFFLKMKEEEEKRLEMEQAENMRKMHENNNINFDMNKMENTLKDTLENFRTMLEQNQNNNNLIDDEYSTEEILIKEKEIEMLKEKLRNAKNNLEQKKLEYEEEMRK